MTFAHPWWLATSVAVVLLAVAYVVVDRRRGKDTVTFANLELLDSVMPRRPGPARHAGFAVILVGLLLLVVALAGPTTPTKVPRNRAVVMLAVDVSLSMKATDVKPSRLAAAKTAAKQFTRDLTPGVNLGVLAFAGVATVLASPSTDRERAIAAIDSLHLDERTATGEAIISSLQAIDMFSRTYATQGVTVSDEIPARIVLMTDGKRTSGRSGPEAARRAKEAGVPVSVIAFGTNHASVEVDGTTVPVPLDTQAMRKIARISGGDFHTAHTAMELEKVYSQLGEQIGYEVVDRDASRPWLIAGAIVIVLGAAGALATSRRIP